MRLADANCVPHRFMRRTVISTILVGALQVYPFFERMRYTQCFIPVFYAPENRLRAGRIRFPTGEGMAKQRRIGCACGIHFRSLPKVPLRLQHYREWRLIDTIVDMIDRETSCGGQTLLSLHVLFMYLSSTLSSLREKCQMLIKLLSQGTQRIDKRKWWSLVEDYLSGGYVGLHTEEKRSHLSGTFKREKNNLIYIPLIN